MGGILSLLSAALDQFLNIPTPPLTEKNLPDQTGKVFLITGANCGVGYEVSRILYSLNGTVYMGCRSESKAQEAIDSIKSAHPTSTGKLVYLHLNLGDLTTIKSTVESFLAQESRLDWLNQNAGVMLPHAGTKTTQNHELQLGTNILGPFLLAKLLLPVLKSAASAAQSRLRSAGSGPGTVRVSWACSFAVDCFSPNNGIEFDSAGTPNDFGGGIHAYATSKVANWWLAYEFGKRSGNVDGVLHNAYNPGNLRSGITRHLKSGSVLGGSLSDWFLQWFVLYPPVMGAYTEIYAGLSRELVIERDQGGFIAPWGRKSTWNREDVVVQMREGGGSEKLWEWCERETRMYA